MKNIFLYIVLINSFLFGAINIDSGKGNVNLLLDRGNVLKFPFLIEEATIATSDKKNYELVVKKNSLTIIPSGEEEDTADLIIWTGENDTFIITLKNNGNKQIFDFTYNGETGFRNAKSSAFETGKIDSDIKKIIKSIKLKSKIAGYSKVKIKRQFKTPTMLMQKDYIYNGGKYRVEEWYIKNITRNKLFLDEATFYTKGIIAIDFEQRELKTRETIKMILIINKSSLVKE